MNDFVSNDGSTNCASEGQTFEEAQESQYKDKENEAITREYNSLVKNSVWELVDRPKDENFDKCKWI